VEVYPRPNGEVYICGIGGSDYISKDDLKEGAFRDVCEPNQARVEAAKGAFGEMASLYKKEGELEKTQACMRPCPPDAMPYMGPIPGYEGAYINAGHNCWGIAWAPACGIGIAELVLDGAPSSIDLSAFDPTRFTTKATSRGRKRQGTNVGEQW
jgi:glycine/D-amino acid oxidase-like deaminating enzyme